MLLQQWHVSRYARRGVRHRGCVFAGLRMKQRRRPSMQMRPITAHPSKVMVEQLAAAGVKYFFYNSGLRVAHFVNALYAHPNIHGILGLHEGSVTAAAGATRR